MKTNQILVAIVATLALTGAASANSVYDLITGDGLAIGSVDTNWTLTAPNGQSATPYVVNRNSAWLSASNFGDAQWLSPAPSANTSVADGDWTYSLPLTLGAGTWIFQGEYSSDNIVTDILLVNGVTHTLVGHITPLGASSPDTQFKNVVQLDEQAVVAAGGGDFELQFIVHNTDGYGGSPSGLIVNGSAVLVPFPTAGWAGFALMGAVGGVAGIKRRLRRH
jgi:hypothetical protein